MKNNSLPSWVAPPFISRRSQLEAPGMDFEWTRQGRDVQKESWGDGDSRDTEGKQSWGKTNSEIFHWIPPQCPSLNPWILFRLFSFFNFLSFLWDYIQVQLSPILGFFSLNNNNNSNRVTPYWVTTPFLFSLLQIKLLEIHVFIYCLHFFTFQPQIFYNLLNLIILSKIANLRGNFEVFSDFCQEVNML